MIVIFVNKLYQQQTRNSWNKMSLQQYFSNKKATFCAFFQNFQLTIKELSIASQLQIDREYFNAKSAVGTETNQGNANNCIASFCASMKYQQSNTLKKIVSLLFQHIYSQINLIYSTQLNIPQFIQHVPIPVKQQPYLVIQNVQNPKQNQLQLCIIKQNKMESPQKLQVSQNSQRTISKDKLKKTEQSGILLSPGMKADVNTNNSTNMKQMVYQSQETVKKDMSSGIVFNHSNSESKKPISLNKNGKREEKQSEQQGGKKVIQLLNKKRSYSTGRQTANDRFTNSVPNNSLNNSRNDRYSSANKYIPKQLNPIAQCPALDPLSPTSRDANNNSKHKYNYNYNYNQYRQQASQINGKLHQAQLIDQPSELSLQTNQLLCQKLDKKIHEQAVGMLYKAKSKRCTVQMGAGYSKNTAHNRNDRSVGNTIINSSINQKLHPQIHRLLANNKTGHPKQEAKNIYSSQGMAKDRKYELSDISKNVIPISLVRNHSTNYIGSFNQQQRF